MKNKNFTLTFNTIFQHSYVVLLFLFTIGFAQGLFAQTQDCPLSCNDAVQVSLDDHCLATVTPEMIIEGENDGVDCNYEIFSITRANGTVVGYAESGTGNWILDGDASPAYTYENLVVTVGFQGDQTNSCMMMGLRLEDKIAPTLRCLDTVHVSCSEDLDDYLTTDTDYKYSYTGPQEIVPSVGPNYSSFPFTIASGTNVVIPFDVDNQANQSEIVNYVQAVLTLSTTYGVTVVLTDGNGNVSSALSTPFTDNNYYGMQATDPNLNGDWYIKINNNSGTTLTVSNAQLRIKSTGFLRIGDGVIVNDNCHLSSATLKVLADYTEQNEDNCGEYFYERKIQYQGTDWRGMKTPICTHVIRWDHKGFDDMAWPHNWDGIDTLPLSCSGYFMKKGVSGALTDTNVKWDTNGDGYPQPGEIDVPTIDGNPIWPEMGYCMMNVLYTDEVHELCPGSFKILRKWIAYDMCEAGSDGCCNDDENPRTHYQLIKVMDLTPITFETYTQNTYTVSTKPFTCTADVTLPEPIIENYGCSDGYEYVVGYCSDGTGIFENFDNITYNSTTNRYTIYDLPEGETCVRYRLTDECGNVSEGTLTVLVVDNIPPIAVCDEHTVATVGTDCTARIYAETFDDGSFDNCTDVTFTVAKMNGSTVGTFGPYVTYSSSDVGNTRTVVMQVTDENGLSNTCMVSVYIDDKIGPTIVCPDDVTVDCDVNPYDVTLTGGDAEYWDNCSATLTYTDNGTLNQCNVGTITRTWTVTDNGGRTATCTQYVTVENNDPFNMLSSNWPADRTNLVGCSNADTDPASTGEPDLSDDGYCSMVAATYKDRTFNVVSGACYKILRDWTVIDWCQYNDHSPEYLGLAGHPYVGMWTHTQVIMVNDTNDPEFTSSCDNVEVCAYNSNCTGDVSLTATATDECTPDDELVYTYLVTGGTTSVNYSGTTNTFEKANMALGTYYITWTVEDKCGNLAHCSYTFVVEDCKNPTPLCYSEITTVVMPSTTPRMVSVTARDFDRGSTDNCTEGSTCGSCETDLRFSFSGTDPYDSIRVFDESNVGLNTLDMWVWDEAGNRDYCTVTLYVQDNVSGSGSLVAGLVQTEDDQSVSDVNVSAEDMVGHESFGSESGSTGLYQFDLPQSTNYKLTANKNDDYLNGLTTLDIVLIQKHLLGIKKLGSPYKILAADANFDSKVSASDLVQLRNLILGKTESLSNRGPWGFVNSNYEFVDQYNPWEESTDEMYYIVLPDLSSDQLENDFTALKIGDVNNSVVLNSTSGLINPRSTVNLEFDDQMIEKGQSIEIPFYLTDMNDIEGMQFSLDFNSSVLNIESVTGQEIALDDNYYNIKDSKLNLSWNRLTEGQIDVTKPLFTIRFNTVAGGLLSNAINLDNSISAEAYDDNLTVNGISLKVRNGIDDVFKIYQNTPNPFTNETEIGFVLPEAGNVNITVYDITGKVLFTKSSDFDKGFNSVNVSRDDLNSASGVLYYKIENGVNSAVKKMVLMAK